MQAPDDASDDTNLESPRDGVTAAQSENALSQVRDLVMGDHFDKFLRQEFDKYDVNGDGELEFTEIRPLLEVLCMMISKNLHAQIQAPTRAVLFGKFKHFAGRNKFITRDQFGSLLREVLYVAMDTASQPAGQAPRVSKKPRASNTSRCPSATPGKVPRLRGVSQSYRFTCMKPFTEDAAEKRLRLAKEASLEKARLFSVLKKDTGGGGTDWQDLESLQALFMVRDERGRVGVTQGEFMRLFTAYDGSVKGPFRNTVDPDDIFDRLQVMCEDDTEGFVDWDAFSTFLVSCEEVFENQETAPPLVLVDNCQTRVTDKHFHHKTSIVKVLVHCELERYYTASSDGIVKAWRSSSLAYETTVFDPGTDSVVISALLILPHSSCLLVCRNDRILHMYTCSFEGTSLLRTFMAAPYLARGLQTRTFTVGENPFDCNVDIEGRLVGTRDLSHRINNFMLVRKKHKQLYCAIPGLSDIVTSACVVTVAVKSIENDVVSLGTDSGTVVLLALAWTGAVANTLVSVKAHKAAVTSVACLTDRRALLTSSLDHTVKVVNIDKEAVVATINTPHNPNNILGGGVLQFIYDANLQMSAFTTGANKVYVGSLVQTGSVELTEHKSLVTDVLWIADDVKNPLSSNKRLTYLVTLSGSDKTIKVWETTNFRCVQTIVDKKKRIGAEDKLVGLAYDRTTRRLLVGCSSHLMAFSLRHPEAAKRKQRGTTKPTPAPADPSGTTTTQQRPGGDTTSPPAATLSGVLQGDHSAPATVGADPPTPHPLQAGEAHPAPLEPLPQMGSAAPSRAGAQLAVPKLQKSTLETLGKGGAGIPSSLNCGGQLLHPTILLYSEEHSHVIACDEGMLCTWDVRDGEVTSLFDHPGSTILHAAIYPSAEQLLSLLATKPSGAPPMFEPLLTLWNCRFGLKMREFRKSLPSPPEGHPLLCLSACSRTVMAGWGGLSIWREPSEEVNYHPVVEVSQVECPPGRGDVCHVAWCEHAGCIAATTVSGAVLFYSCERPGDNACPYTLSHLVDLSMSAQDFGSPLQMKETRDVATRFANFRNKAECSGGGGEAKNTPPVAGASLGFCARLLRTVTRRRAPLALSANVMLSVALGGLVVLWLNGRALAFFAGAAVEEGCVTDMQPVRCSRGLGVACADTSGVISLFDVAPAVEELERAYKLGPHSPPAGRGKPAEGEFAQGEQILATQSEQVQLVVSFKAHDAPIRALCVVLPSVELLCSLSQEGLKLHRRNGIPVTVLSTAPTEAWPIKVTPRGSAIIRFLHLSSSSTDALHHTRNHAVHVKRSVRLANIPSATAAALASESVKNTAPLWEMQGSEEGGGVGSLLPPLLPRTCRPGKAGQWGWCGKPRGPVVEAGIPVVHIPEDKPLGCAPLPRVTSQQATTLIWDEPRMEPVPGLPNELLP